MPLKKPCAPPSSAANPATTAAGNATSVATNIPSIKNESAPIISSESAAPPVVASPANPPASHATGKMNSARRPAAVPRNPARSASASPARASPGDRKKCPIPSYTGPNPVVTRCASAGGGNNKTVRHAAARIDRVSLRSNILPELCRRERRYFRLRWRGLVRIRLSPPPTENKRRRA